MRYLTLNEVLELYHFTGTQRSIVGCCLGNGLRLLPTCRKREKEEASVIRSIDNVGIAVSDLEAGLRFYQALGFEPEYRDESSAMIRAGTAHLYLFVTTNQKSLSRSFDLTGNPLGIDHISLEVEDVDALCGALEAQGVTLARPPQDYDWGARAACLYDPDGNCIWLLQR